MNIKYPENSASRQLLSEKTKLQGEKHTFDIQHVNGVWVVIVLDLILIKIN